MLLSIKTSTGKNITVEAPKNVKTEVRDKQGVVFTVSYGEVTGDPITIEASDAIENLNVKVVETQQKPHRQGIRIYVKTSEKTIILDTTASDTIASVKARIWEKRGFPPNLQKLYLENLGTVLCNDQKTLSDYNIKNGSVLRLEVPVKEKLNVSVKTLFGKTIPISIKNTDTVETLKFKVQNKYGVPPDQQRLVFGRAQLENDRALFAYNIRDEDTIHLVSRLRL